MNGDRPALAPPRRLRENPTLLADRVLPTCLFVIPHLEDRSRSTLVPVSPRGGGMLEHAGRQPRRTNLHFQSSIRIDLSARMQRSARPLGWSGFALARYWQGPQSTNKPIDGLFRFEIAVSLIFRNARRERRSKSTAATFARVAAREDGTAVTFVASPPFRSAAWENTEVAAPGTVASRPLRDILYAVSERRRRDAGREGRRGQSCCSREGN